MAETQIGLSGLSLFALTQKKKRSEPVKKAKRVGCMFETPSVNTRVVLVRLYSNRIFCTCYILLSTFKLGKSLSIDDAYEKTRNHDVGLTALKDGASGIPRLQSEMLKTIAYRIFFHTPYHKKQPHAKIAQPSMNPILTCCYDVYTPLPMVRLRQN